MTKLHTAKFHIRDNPDAYEYEYIQADTMEMRLPSLRRLSVNGVMWKVGDILEFLSIQQSFDMVH
jgi:hypothetical protein